MAREVSTSAENEGYEGSCQNILQRLHERKVAYLVLDDSTKFCRGSCDYPSSPIQTWLSIFFYFFHDLGRHLETHGTFDLFFNIVEGSQVSADDVQLGFSTRWSWTQTGFTCLSLA